MIRRSPSLLAPMLFITRRNALLVPENPTYLEYAKELRRNIPKIFAPIPSSSFEKFFVSHKDQIDVSPPTNEIDKRQHYRNWDVVLNLLMIVLSFPWQ